jgi:hypothetical protein
MGKYKSYEEYIQSDWYKKYSEKIKSSKNIRELPKGVKEKLYERTKRNRMIDYVLSIN